MVIKSKIAIVKYVAERGIVRYMLQHMNCILNMCYAFRWPKLPIKVPERSLVLSVNVRP